MDWLVGSLEMAQLDQETIDECGVPGRVLMEVAGRAVADKCAFLRPSKGNVVVVCGVGNNGGDGFVAAKALVSYGYSVSVFVVGDRARLKTDAASALLALAATETCRIRDVTDARMLLTLTEELGNADLVIDALLGTGLQRDVRGLVAEAIDVINESRVDVVAVDIPSGVDADTGAVLGRAVQAYATVTFAYAKRGHYLFPGAGLRGQLQVADIGIPRRLADSQAIVGQVALPVDGSELLPKRSPESHKGSHGHLVVVAGCEATPGAAILALRAALRSGVGLVSWAVDRPTLLASPERPAEVMLRLRGQDEPADWAWRILEGATAVLVGPGLSTAPGVKEDLKALLETSRVPLCLDADGLNVLAASPELWDLIKVPVVVTPHPKEMARLMDRDVSAVQRDRFAAALELASGRRIVVVLKGAGTVVAEPLGQVAVIGAGNPGLATGGTGDVLAGVVGSILAQGVEGPSAAIAGALLHAVAGDRAAAQFGEAGMQASDVIDELGPVLQGWRR